MNIRNLKMQKEQLENVIKKLDEFNEQTITPANKQQLKLFLRELKSLGFNRKDKDNMVTIHLNGMPSQLSEVVTIVNHNGKYFIDTWRLWKTIHSIEERIQEYAAMD